MDEIIDALLQLFDEMPLAKYYKGGEVLESQQKAGEAREKLSRRLDKPGRDELDEMMAQYLHNSGLCERAAFAAGLRAGLLLGRFV